MANPHLSTMTNPVRVTIVEDHEPTLATLGNLVRSSTGFECAGQHINAEKALKKLARECPDVVLLDLELPGMSGIEFIRKIRSCRPRTEILVLTLHDEARLIFEALESGATGYLVKPVEPSRILEAITEVWRGGAPMSSQIARLVIKSFHHRGRERRDLEALTPREEEILRLLARGCRYQEIATELGIAIRTVSTHLHNIYEKLHVRSATEATARFLR
jgi:DNA-binding NarL/FixJ family response regulator